MNILITGASSGIGEALAYEYAKRRAQTLYLCGRDNERLAKVADKCQRMGCTTTIAETKDVTDGNAMAEWLARCDAQTPLDTVHANAGISAGKEEMDNTRAVFAVNVDGVVNTVLPAITLFRDKTISRRRRQIAITASIAGYHGLPACPAYSATKAAVKAWGEGLRGMLATERIWVNVICPGFVRSRITAQNTCPMPFFMEAEKAASIIVNRLDRNVGLIAFPWQLRFATWLVSAMPNRISQIVYSALPPKA